MLAAAQQESSLGREPFLAEVARSRKPHRSGAHVQLQKETENPRSAAELILDEVANLFFPGFPFALSDEGLEGFQPARG
jgi:hypothetical protein